MNGLPEKALDLFEDVLINVDEILCTVVFSACAAISDERAVRLGKKLLREMPNAFLAHDSVVSSAIHMMMKFRDVKHAEQLFGLQKKKSNAIYGTMLKGNENMIEYVIIVDSRLCDE